MIDDIRMPLTEWIARHNRWADGEVAELNSQETAGRLQTRRPRQSRRSANDISAKNTIACRCSCVRLALFVYRYFFRLGFLDGTEGLIFWVLQTFWFRFLVDAKIWEKRHAARLAQEAPDNSSPK